MFLNKVMLYGNLTRDPEVKALPSGQMVANLTIATNRKYKDKNNQQQEQTEFHNCVAFGRTAEVIGQYFKKGRAIYIDGRLQTRSWDKDGVKQYRTEIMVDSFQFGASSGGDSRSQSQSQAGSMTGDYKPDVEFPEDDINPEDIPF